MTVKAMFGTSIFACAISTEAAFALAESIATAALRTMRRADRFQYAIQQSIAVLHLEKRRASRKAFCAQH